MVTLNLTLYHRFHFAKYKYIDEILASFATANMFSIQLQELKKNYFLKKLRINWLTKWNTDHNNGDMSINISEKKRKEKTLTFVHTKKLS